LTNGNVDAVKSLVDISSFLEVALLIENGVDSNSCLSCLSISNDELSLSSTNGHERVDGLEAGLHWLMHGLSGDDSRSLELDSLPLLGKNGALSIDGVTESVKNSAEHFLSNWNIDD
jgi:hypothetical protein